jgi:hypothetical protein
MRDTTNDEGKLAVLQAVLPKTAAAFSRVRRLHPLKDPPEKDFEAISTVVTALLRVAYSMAPLDKEDGEKDEGIIAALEGLGEALKHWEEVITTEILASSVAQGRSLQ